MKVISRKDLILLLPLLKSQKSFSIDDFERLLDIFGDDYFAEGGKLEKTTESEEMAKLREWDRSCKVCL